MKFKSKIDLWVHLIVICFAEITLFVLYSCVTTNNKIGIIVVLLYSVLMILLICPIYFLTYYTFEESCLHIRCGLIVNIKINYNNIVSFKESKSIVSSPALSIDRLEIEYYENSRHNSILISPKRKQEFMDTLNKHIT